MIFIIFFPHLYGLTLKFILNSKYNSLIQPKVAPNSLNLWEKEKLNSNCYMSKKVDFGGVKSRSYLH